MTNNIDIIKEILTSMEELEECSKDLKEDLSTQDKMIADIHHFIEFKGAKNMAQKVQLFDLLQNTLKTRREIKREYKQLAVLMEGVPAMRTVLADNLKVVKAEIKKPTPKIYNTRVLTGLFGKTIK